ncbi:type II toxin-antitoxin system VapC family toxin [Halochromatium glycolicum]|jgi:hypothetical protein|uniref:PIN domain-containing protein n=1 Tax=Halochromatium glycolicum TaxID=85075 RepID=A0AAJ0X9T7_9GAMM|nr:type II toxin-antitoxin system VapC family toxin [Halochromatium glycolicum]MBK1704583.1 hypothetical protein [Halochromatium glycolicum]
MTYVDTSVLLAMFLNESKTGDTWGWFNRQAPGSTLISKWTLTEIASALGVKRRMQVISDSLHDEVLSKVRQFVQSDFVVLIPDAADFDEAASLCDQWQSGLRAGDALHIAIAERRGMSICTLDGVMSDAATHLEIVVHAP